VDSSKGRGASPTAGVLQLLDHPGDTIPVREERARIGGKMSQIPGDIGGDQQQAARVVEQLGIAAGPAARSIARCNSQKYS